MDHFSFKDMDDLRKAFLKVIDDYLERFPEPREVIPGNEFYFKEAVILVFPAALRASNLAEFFIAIKYIDAPSVYYHFYEAKMRLRSGIDDFSKPILLRVSRFDRFKDPVGVIRAYQIVKKYNDRILILAESPASDDPEGEKTQAFFREPGSEKERVAGFFPCHR